MASEDRTAAPTAFEALLTLCRKIVDDVEVKGIHVAVSESAASSSGREVSGEGPMISRPDSPAVRVPGAEPGKVMAGDLRTEEPRHRASAASING